MFYNEITIFINFVKKNNILKNLMFLDFSIFNKNKLKIYF